MKTARILIADDHELLREGLKTCIEKTPGWQVCAEAADGREAVKLARQHQPDIAVLDVGMAELNGIEAARQIHQSCPKTGVLMLTMQDSDELIRSALAAGARGFLLKTDAAPLLATALTALLAGRPYFTGRVSEIVLAGFLQPDFTADAAAEPGDRLTAREREIVQLLAEAHTSKDIAVRLGISVKTVDAHRANVMRKLNLHSIAELVRYAMRNKIIHP